MIASIRACEFLRGLSSTSVLSVALSTLRALLLGQREKDHNNSVGTPVEKGHQHSRTAQLPLARGSTSQSS